MFDMRGYKISVRGVHANDEPLPKGATMIVEGGDLGEALIVAVNDEGDVLVKFPGDKLPDDVAASYGKAAVAVRDALAAEMRAIDERPGVVTS